MKTRQHDDMTIPQPPIGLDYIVRIEHSLGGRWREIMVRSARDSDTAEMRAVSGAGGMKAGWRAVHSRLAEPHTSRKGDWNLRR